MSAKLNISSLGPKRFVHLLFGVAVLVLIVGGAVIYLMNTQIQGLNAAVANKESQVGSSEQIAQRYEQTQAAYDTVAAQTQTLEASVSPKSFVPTLLKQVQALATQTHLTVNSFRPGDIVSPTPPADAKTADGDKDVAKKKAPPPPYDTMDINLAVTGTYADTATFLYGLTTFPKIISVASVQMAPGGGSAADSAGGSPILSTNLHLTAFVFHSDDKAAAVGGRVSPAASKVTLTSSQTTSPGAAQASSAQLASPFQPRAGAHPLGAVADAASHAATRAVGADKAARARGEAGVGTL